MEIIITNVKIWSAGTAQVVTIPQAYIKNGLVDLKKQYNLVLTEAAGEHKDE